jgi:hypothetical protein
MKSVYILTGVSGAGKSTVAEDLVSQGGVICCADDYFTDADGVYTFVPERIWAAHKQCQEKFKLALTKPDVTRIVVANTNTTPKDYKFYEEWAEKGGAKVFHLVVQNRHGGQNKHNVPEETLQKQERNIRDNLKLR